MNNVTAVYFSPTGNSKKAALAAAYGISNAVEEVDFTVNCCNIEFAKKDFVIFSVPVYAGRIPLPAAERLKQFEGNGTPCAVIATYGNREFDDALLEMADMLVSQGFVVKGAAGIIGRHTYGEIQIDRPDDKDLQDCAQFGKQVFESDKKWPEFIIPGNRPYRDGMKKGNFQPLTDETCIRCGLCKESCPVSAIGDDCISINEETCISCFRCIRNCPVKAKNMNSEKYITFAADFTEKLKVRKENEFFL